MSHPENPAEIPGVAVQQHETVIALETRDQDDDPIQLERAIENADFDPAQFDSQEDIGSTTPNDDTSTGGRDIEYEIIFDTPLGENEDNPPQLEDGSVPDDEASTHQDSLYEEEKEERYPRRERTPARHINIGNTNSSSYDDGHIHVQVENIDE